MPITPEDKARQTIDRLLEAAGWKIQDRKELNLSLPGGVAVREFPMPGFGEADYLLFVDGKALGVVEAKKEGETLTHVERQTEKYSKGLPDFIDAPVKPLPFRYESTGVETRFTNGLEPDAASRNVFAIHEKNELYPYKEDVDARFADWIEQQKQHGVTFSGEQMLWLEAIRDHVGTNIEIDKEDFEDFPFVQMGGLGKAYKLFGEKLQPMLAELNEVLVA